MNQQTSGQGRSAFGSENKPSYGVPRQEILDKLRNVDDFTVIARVDGKVQIWSPGDERKATELYREGATHLAGMETTG